MEEEDPPEEGAIIVRRPKCACNTACPDTLQPVCASDGNTVSDRQSEGRFRIEVETRDQFLACPRHATKFFAALRTLFL